ncbi:molybdate ABC transporter substrate-binding protein [Sinomicrobium sp. M5D2P17]
MIFFRKIFPYFLFSLVFISCKPEARTKVTVATAANMKFAMQALVKDFTEKTGIACEMVVSSSGKLTAQIREGAPYDVFVSADMKYPEVIYREGLALAPPEIYAYGKLVLWSVSGKVLPSVAQLTQPGIKHIALANPRNAPYGTAAVEVLKHYGIWDEIQEKIVYGESISQTNHFITSGAAEAGFTALSVVRSPEMQGTGRWTAPDTETYTLIQQGVVVIPHEDADTQNARKFYDYLFSPGGRKVLKDFGYLVDE